MSNRAFLWIAGIAIIAQCILFKLLYPYAGFINGDSYVYIQSAYANMDINTYPVGYSKFLRLFSIFTKSDTALVAFQYLAIEISALWLLFTLFSIFLPGRLTRWLMFIFLVFNPVFLYVSNYVSSDAFFLALSITWFTSLLWILKKPTIKMMVFQVALLFLAFTVRYNALYYPLIAALALVLSHQPVRFKFIGIGAGIFVVAVFILYTSNQYYQLTGIRQFSPFSGWQIANNAMYAYRYVDSQHLKKVPADLLPLDRLVRHYFDTSRDLNKHPEEMLLASTMYMWDDRSPLQKYMLQQTQKDSDAGILKRWALMAPIYAKYGSYLIRQYPTTYFEYYLLPNALKYYTPPGEFLDEYNAGKDTVALIAQVWFKYDSKKVKTAFKDNTVNVLQFMPTCAAIANVVFIISFLAVLILKYPNRQTLASKTLILAIAVWTANFGFSVFASPITLRYQLFPILLSTFFALLLVDYIYTLAFNTPHSASN